MKTIEETDNLTRAGILYRPYLKSPHFTAVGGDRADLPSNDFRVGSFDLLCNAVLSIDHLDFGKFEGLFSQ